MQRTTEQSVDIPVPGHGVAHSLRTVEQTADFSVPGRVDTYCRARHRVGSGMSIGGMLVSLQEEVLVAVLISRSPKEVRTYLHVQVWEETARLSHVRQLLYDYLRSGKAWKAPRTEEFVETNHSNVVPMDVDSSHRKGGKGKKGKGKGKNRGDRPRHDGKGKGNSRYVSHVWGHVVGKFAMHRHSHVFRNESVLGQTTSSQCYDRRWTCSGAKQMTPIPTRGWCRTTDKTRFGSVGETPFFFAFRHQWPVATLAWLFLLQSDFYLRPRRTREMSWTCP